jgi:hypothetical protein
LIYFLLFDFFFFPFLRSFFYFDPIRKLSKDAQARWADPKKREEMIAEAKRKAGY